ncbi:MAG: beta strand repeat-containing protein, partial [Candidatus Binatia bacterium]
VSALVLTLDAGSDLTTESGVALTITPELDPVGPEATTTVDIDALSRTFTRSTGSWLDDGFAVGQEITVGGSALNSNNVGEHYVVGSVTALVLTVDPGLTMTDELGATVSVIAPGGDIQTIVIDKREDVDVEAPGTLDVDAHDSVYIGSEDNSINLGLVETDGLAGSDDVRLKSGQAITNADGNGATNVIAGDTILEAASGSIGTSGTPVYTNLTPGGTITGRASTNIYIVERSGDMNVEFMFAQTGSDGVVLKTLNGSIVDALDTDFTKIAANHVKLTAINGGIGELGDYLDIDVAGAGTLEADADDDIFIAETFGNMNVHHVTSTTGDVDLKAAISLLDALNSPLPEIIGNNITLTAELGGIGVAGNDVDIDSAHSGPGQLTATSLLANAYIIETDGSGPTLDDLTINEVSSGPAFTTFITAPEGSILNGKPNDDPNVISGYTYLIALNDIGASDKPLTTEVGFIEGKSILGSTWIFNYGELTEGGVTDSGEPGMVAGGDVTVTADSPIDVTENIVADNITLNARDDSADDHLVIHTGFRLETAVFDFVTTTWVRSAGTITLQAGDSFLLESGAQILTNGVVIINGDFNTDEIGNILPGNNDPGDGAEIVVNGTITANQITITGNDDDDTVLIDVFDEAGDAITGNVDIFGGDGHDLVIIDELHSRDLATSVDVDGQGDTDDTVVNVRAGGTEYIINVTDSGAPDDGADTLTINGTEIGDDVNASGEDLFLVRSNFVAYLTPDPAHLPEPDPYHLLAAVERINYDESINGRLIVNGGTADDEFYVDDNSSITTLDGGAGADFFQIGQVFGTERTPPAVASGDEIATVFTTRGWLSVGVTFPMVVYGGSGNDTMQVYSNKAELRLEGNAGDDTFIIRAFALADPLTGKVLKDLSTAAQTAALGGDGNDLIQY